MAILFFTGKNINTKVMVQFEPMLNELHVEVAEQETNLFTFILSRKAYQEVLTMLTREIWWQINTNANKYVITSLVNVSCQYETIIKTHDRH